MINEHAVLHHGAERVLWVGRSASPTRQVRESRGYPGELPVPTASQRRAGGQAANANAAPLPDTPPQVPACSFWPIESKSICLCDHLA